MLNSETEKKIVEFVRNSPLGVTSQDIALYLGLNRMTIAKYMAVIKEKALVDFKQLGMAKLWFVPVTLNKKSYFKEILLNLGPDVSVKKAAIATAKRIDEEYKAFHSSGKLSYSQVIDAIVDAQKKVGGKFTVLEKTDEVIALKNSRCPFGERVVPSLCACTSALCGVITAKNLDYSKVILKKTIASGSDECLIHIYLKRTQEKGTETEEYANS